MYFFKCSRCNFTLAGVRKNQQKVRFLEHTGISSRTGKTVIPALVVNVSKINKHILMNQHTAMVDDFATLSMRGDKELLEIKERIMIKILKPLLNDNTI